MSGTDVQAGDWLWVKRGTVISNEGGPYITMRSYRIRVLKVLSTPDGPVIIWTGSGNTLRSAFAKDLTAADKPTQDEAP